MSVQAVVENLLFYGIIPAEHCEQCDYCVETMIQEEVIDVNELGMNKKQRDYQRRYANA